MTLRTELFAGRYHFVRRIGQGGMSDVYEAVDEHDGTAVAVKVVRSGDPSLVRRLAQEVRALQLVDDPGLVRLLETGVENGQAYLIMELVVGCTLEEFLRRGPLSPPATSELGGSLARSLLHVHEQGIVHRDMKPSNVLLAGDGRVLLGDFGIARLLDSTTLTLDGTTVGTVAYMAPEQLEDHEVGPGADIWSLGVVLLECLTGRRVYQGSGGEIIARRLSGPVPLPADLPVPWRLLLTGMLDHRPQERLTGAQVAALLATAPFSSPWKPAAPEPAPGEVSSVPATVAGLDPAPPARTMTRVAPTYTAPRAPRRRRVWALGMLAVVAAIVAVVLVLFSGPAASPGVGHSPPHTSGSTHHTGSSTSTSTSTSTTTTTTAPSASGSLGALFTAVTSGVQDGSLDRGQGGFIVDEAQQALTDEDDGSPSRAANDLQQAASAIANGTQQGSITPAEASVLQNDLSALAGALGLGAAASAPTTTTPTPTTTTPTTPRNPAGPGNGGTGPTPGHGPGHDH